MRHAPRAEFSNLPLAMMLGAALWAVIIAAVWFFPYVVLFVVGTNLLCLAIYFCAMFVLTLYQIRHGEEP